MSTISPIPWPSERTISKPTWTPPVGTRIISSDDHVIEDGNLWIERLPAKYRDRAPKIWQEEDKTFHMSADGRSLDVPGLDTRISEGHEGMWNQQRRLADMEAENIEASIVFHGRTPALMGLGDKDLYYVCLDAYNEWLSEWSAKAPKRLYGVAFVPTIYRPGETRDYLQKIKALGFKAMEIPLAPRERPYNSSEMEPFWDAVEESGIPLSFHVGAYLNYRGYGALGANITNNLAPYRGLWALLTFSGILERHPGMRVVFTEGGGAWAASAITDADYVYRTYATETASAITDADYVYRTYATEMKPKLANLPSFYWRRQCYATFMDDPIAYRLIDIIGEDNLLWCSDYPHAESCYGSVNATVKSIFDAVGERAGKKLAGANEAKLWGI